MYNSALGAKICPPFPHTTYSHCFSSASMLTPSFSNALCIYPVSSEKSAPVRRDFPLASEAITSARFVRLFEPGTVMSASIGFVSGVISMQFITLGKGGNVARNGVLHLLRLLFQIMRDVYNRRTCNCAICSSIYESLYMLARADAKSDNQRNVSCRADALYKSNRLITDIFSATSYSGNRHKIQKCRERICMFFRFMDNHFYPLIVCCWRDHKNVSDALRARGLCKRRGFLKRRVRHKNIIYAGAGRFFIILLKADLIDDVCVLN